MDTSRVGKGLALDRARLADCVQESEDRGVVGLLRGPLAGLPYASDLLQEDIDGGKGSGQRSSS